MDGQQTSRDASTSRDAYNKAKRSRADHAGVVWWALKNVGPMTRSEIAAQTGLKIFTVNGRCADLRMGGSVRLVGRRGGESVLAAVGDGPIIQKKQSITYTKETDAFWNEWARTKGKPDLRKLAKITFLIWRQRHHHP